MPDYMKNQKHWQPTSDIQDVPVQQEPAQQTL